MARQWAQAMVEEIRRIDAEESPHGLYGLRESRRTGERLPKLPFILAAPPLRLLKRMEVAQHVVQPAADFLEFHVNRRSVGVWFRTFADTKVRRFGDAFRLDKANPPDGRIPPELKTLLPRMAKGRDTNFGRQVDSRGLLLLAHFARERDLRAAIEAAVAPAFLQKHGLSHCGVAWHDDHGRDFWSTAQLWHTDLQQ